jgi:hypothetical protein
MWTSASSAGTQEGEHESARDVEELAHVDGLLGPVRQVHLARTVVQRGNAPGCIEPQVAAVRGASLAQWRVRTTMSA